MKTWLGSRGELAMSSPSGDRSHESTWWSQHRFEQTKIGKLLLSLLLAWTVGAIMVVNLPASQIKTDLVPPALAFLTATGLDQDWSVFAPTPQTTSIFVDARTDYADGTSSVWPVPARTGPISAYVDYHWQKYGSFIRMNDYAKNWQLFATYIANRARAEGKTPVRVTLTRRWADSLPPGNEVAHGVWSKFEFYVLPLGGTR